MYKVRLWNSERKYVANCMTLLDSQSVVQVFKTKGQAMAYINAILDGCNTIVFEIEKCEIEEDF